MPLPIENTPFSLIPFNPADISDFLLSRDSPVMEVELLRIITGEQRMPAARDSLFVLHFSLYHALYNLKYHAGACGFYLHLDPMRIRLIKTPGAGRCHHYFPETGIHCGHPSDGGSYCNRHHDPYSLTAISYAVFCLKKKTIKNIHAQSDD